MKWTEQTMQAALSTASFLSTSVLVVPNCCWTGNETDMLVIEPNGRIVDIEVKISRADLKADAKKDKWWKPRPWSRRHAPREPAQWPAKVWKHYYAFPAELWDDKLLEHLPPASGVLLVGKQGGPFVEVKRRAKPNKDAKPVATADVWNLARLSSLRYWAIARERIAKDQLTGAPT